MRAAVYAILRASSQLDPGRISSTELAGPSVETLHEQTFDEGFRVTGKDNSGSLH
jgi:hypothetical protein